MSQMVTDKSFSTWIKNNITRFNVGFFSLLPLLNRFLVNDTLSGLRVGWDNHIPFYGTDHF